MLHVGVPGKYVIEIRIRFWSPDPLWWRFWNLGFLDFLVVLLLIGCSPCLRSGDSHGGDEEEEEDVGREAAMLIPRYVSHGRYDGLTEDVKNEEVGLDEQHFQGNKTEVDML